MTNITRKRLFGIAGDIVWKSKDEEISDEQLGAYVRELISHEELSQRSRRIAASNTAKRVRLEGVVYPSIQRAMMEGNRSYTYVKAHACYLDEIESDG